MLRYLALQKAVQQTHNTLGHPIHDLLAEQWFVSTTVIHAKHTDPSTAVHCCLLPVPAFHSPGPMLPQLAGLLSCSMLAQSVDLLLQYTLPTAATLQHRKVRTRAIAPPRQVAAAAPSCDAAPNTSAHPSPPSPPLVAQAARVAKQKQFDPLQPFLPDWRSTLPKVPPSSYTVRAAAFSSAAYSMAQLPPPRWPEVAVVGRSNVGKSSLINYLLGSSSLAKVSKHPGG